MPKKYQMIQNGNKNTTKKISKTKYHLNGGKIFEGKPKYADEDD